MMIIMKIGILFIPYGNTYSRYGKDKYLKIKQHGYDAVDYHIASTDSDLYTLSYMSLKEKLLLKLSNSLFVSGLSSILEFKLDSSL